MPKINNKYDRTHLRNMALMDKRIKLIYSKAAEEAAKIGVSLRSFNPDKMFSFDDYPETKKMIDELTSSLHNSMEAAVVNGVRSSWTLSNNKNNALSQRVFGDNIGKLTKEQYARYFSSNGAALDAFLLRKQNGLNLSERVWRYTNDFRNEIEMGLDLGIRSGKDAPSMARELKQYLQYPDKLFRRVRDEHGQLQLSKAAAEFHPGRGVYRSSYKNARRLASTEINMAYRTSDYLRWQQMDFVVGIEVKTSNNHTLLGSDGKPHEFLDICDALAGKYPKDFKFTGWHPHCRCHAEPILKTEEEMDEDTDRILNGEDTTNESVNKVEDVPQAFKDHIEKYSGTIKAVDNARLPYYVQDNTKYVDDTTALLESITVGKDTYILKDLLKECYKVETENGTVYVHPNHGKQEYAENLIMAKWRANEFGEQVVLLPNTGNGTSADSYNLTRKVLEEFKVNSTGTINSIDRAIRDGAKQANNIIIELRSDMSVSDFTDAITDRVNRCGKLEMLRVKIGNCEALYSRGEILKPNFKIKPEDFHIGQPLRSRGVQLSPNTAAKLEKFFDISKEIRRESAKNSKIQTNRHIVRTQQEIEDIKARWEQRKINKSPIAEVFASAKNLGVSTLDVSYYTKQPTIEEIIAKISGGDMTDGSCSSLALTYAANRAGFDVTDYRGGNSRRLFANNYNVKKIIEAAGGIITSKRSDFDSAMENLKTCILGKEYYFTCGQHASIIRRNDKGYEYLELQSGVAGENGWHPLTLTVLEKRFCAKKSHSMYGLKFNVESTLVDIEKLNRMPGFKTMLTYINTKSSEQLKGPLGRIR